MRMPLSLGSAMAGRLIVASAVIVAAAVWFPTVRSLVVTDDSGRRSGRMELLALSGTAALETRPLFHQSRRSSRPNQPAPALAQGGSFEESYRLRGVASGDGETIGIIEQVGTGLSARIRIGQVLDGHRLTAIEPGLAVFETDTGKQASLTRRPAL